MSQRLRAAAVFATTVAAVLAGCSSGSKPAPAPTPVLSTTTVTTLPDHSSDSLVSISGATTLPPVPLTPGHADLNGTVVDDTGAPVAGATVGLDRVVGTQVGQSSVVARADGTWNAPGIIGGIYRVRAWRPPDLAGTASQTVFLAAAESQTLHLTVSHFTGIKVLSSVAPNPPIIREPANIVVEITGSTVGADGYVRAEGQPGVPVQLLGQGVWDISGDGSAVTSSSGYASWEATCQELGPQGLSILVDGSQAYPVDVGPCSPVPPTTTTTTSTTTVPGQTTTTARRRGRTPPTTA